MNLIFIVYDHYIDYEAVDENRFRHVLSWKYMVEFIKRILF